MGSKPQVSIEFTVQGAIAALEQCGLLLHDAVNLFEAGSYSTPLFLAATAREELAKFRFYCEKAISRLNGNPICLRNLKFDNHVTKQQKALLSVVLRFSNDSALGQLVRKQMALDTSDPEWQRTQQKLDEKRKEKANVLPQQRQNQKIKALYVDAESTEKWNLPKSVSKEEAVEFLSDAVNDYSTQLSHIESGRPLFSDENFTETFAKVLGDFRFPVRKWPNHKI